MRFRNSLSALLLIVMSSTAFGQTPSAAGPVRCAECARTGQSPAAAKDRKPTPTVARVEPVWLAIRDPAKEESMRVDFIARVLGTSPLVLDILDSKWLSIDRAMKVVRDDVSGGAAPGTCGGAVVAPVTNEVKSVEATLAFNDIVTGTWLMQRDPADAGTMLVGGPVITAMRKAAAPAPYFHLEPRTPNCRNRSGRLIEYRSRDGERLIVFNDGGIQYVTTLQTFDRYKLSAEELGQLLDTFRAASFDTLPALDDKTAQRMSSTLTLIAARHQVVQVDPRDARLAPVLAALKTVGTRATSEARLILRTGAARTIDLQEAAGAMDLMAAIRLQASRTYVIVDRPDGTRGSEPVDPEKSPELVHVSGPKFLWPGDIGISLADVSADGRVISPDEFENHKAVFTALTKARFTGLSVIDGNRLYEGVRLCQVAPGAGDSCPAAK
jgi:hypothetical protein